MRVELRDGVELAVIDAGPRDAPPLFLVHGFGGAKEDFTDHLDALSSGHRVVLFDHRGHGESAKPADEHAYSLERFATDVVALADALGVKAFRLLGNSMGGMVAQAVVLSHRDRVEALILQDTWPGAPPFPKDGAIKAAEIVRQEGLAGLHARSQGKDALTTPAHERLLRERAGYAEFCDGKFFSQAPEMYAAVVVEILHREDRSKDLGGVSCPTLVMTGEQDPAREGCERIAAVIPGARFVVIPDAGHSPQLENPQVWLATVTGFLDDLDR